MSHAAWANAKPVSAWRAQIVRSLGTLREQQLPHQHRAKTHLNRMPVRPCKARTMQQLACNSSNRMDESALQKQNSTTLSHQSVTAAADNIGSSLIAVSSHQAAPPRSQVCTAFMPRCVAFVCCSKPAQPGYAIAHTHAPASVANLTAQVQCHWSTTPASEMHKLVCRFCSQTHCQQAVSRGERAFSGSSDPTRASCHSGTTKQEKEAPAHSVCR